MKMDSTIHRCVNRNVDASAFGRTPAKEVLHVYRQMARARWFEQCIVELVAKDVNHLIKVKVHMSTGQEGVAAALSLVARNGFQVFTQHRTMDFYIAYSAPPESIRDEILCLDTGCARGRIGGSFNFISPEVQMYGHTGFTGTCAWADPVNELVYVFLSNRTYPDATNRKLIQLHIREQIQEAIYDAMKK